jgi:zinc/manganese transport system ATP-binding protein/zinc transport system ATP-binding protein
MRAGQETPIISLSGVNAGYNGRPVLWDVSLSVREGEFVGVVGPSGSGKTTLLRVILGAIPAQRGSVAVAGTTVAKGHRPAVGYVPQLETIDWNFPVTVEEVVLMGKATRSGPWPWARKPDRERMEALLERLGLGSLRSRHIRALSGGQQQRVFLARALIHSPRLLVLDEPTSGVDIKTRDDILHLLIDLNQDGVTVLLSTHELNAVAAHLPRVLLVNGRVVADGPPARVFTTEVLRRTYGGEMVVVHQDGMTLVADSPHRLPADPRAVAEDQLNQASA